MKKTTDPRVELLRSIPGLGGLPDRELAMLSQLCEDVRLRDGDVLVREGAHGRHAFIIVEGTGTVVHGDDEIAKVGPGAFGGEMSMLDHQPRCATVRADTPMRVLVVGPKDFGSFVEFPKVAKAMALQLSERLRGVEATTC